MVPIFKGKYMRARVVLKGCKTYVVGGKKWIKEVPKVIEGKGLIKSFQENGYFNVAVLKEKKKTKKAEAVAKDGGSTKPKLKK
jgi:hypothetical protein